jgi:tetratricopeptide (TPR) repeat protein
VAEFDRLDQRLPNCPLLLAFRAEALRKREMLTEALRDARRAVEIDPESARAREELGLVLLAQNPPDMAGAEEQAAELLRKDPMMPGASAIQAHVQYMRGNRREAFRMIKKIHAQAPYDLTVREIYGKTFLFDQRPPIDILDHPTGHCLENREWSVGVFLLGHVKRGFPGGLAIGTNTARWISGEPNASLKFRLLREGAVQPAAALDARYIGNMEIEDSDDHASEFPMSLSLSKRMMPGFSFHLGGVRILQDRKSPFPVKDGKAILFRELESYAALDLELLHNLKLLVEPSAVRFEHDDKWEWQGVAGVLLSGSGSPNRIKAGAGFRSWDDSWFAVVGWWLGR